MFNEWLELLYNKNSSCGCTDMMVAHWRKKHGLSVREAFVVSFPFQKSVLAQCIHREAMR